MSWRNTKKTRSKERGQFMKMKGLFLNSWKNCWIFWSVRFYDVSGQLGFMTFLVSQVFIMSLASHKRFYDVSGQSVLWLLISQLSWYLHNFYIILFKFVQVKWSFILSSCDLNNEFLGNNVDWAFYISSCSWMPTRQFAELCWNKMIMNMSICLLSTFKWYVCGNLKPHLVYSQILWYKH